MKRLALVVMPLAGVLYAIVGVIFGFRWMIWVLGAILVVILYLGILVMVTSRYDGKIIISQDEESGKRIFTLELETDPDDMVDMESITFEVVNQLEIRNINMRYNGE